MLVLEMQRQIARPAEMIIESANSLCRVRFEPT